DTESSPVQSPPAPESLRSNPCSSSGSSCGECLRQPQCAWCTQQDFPRGLERCAPEKMLVDSGCSQDAIENPQSKMIQETPLDKAGSDVQLQPGKVRLALRQGAPQTFTVRYRQADDYPVDLYYLMDLTHSMKDHRDKVAELADDMVASMLNVTRNFRLGFGSFIDKVVMPYVDTTPARLQNPCHDTQCAPPYGFHHQLPLTTNSSLFTETVSSAALSGNLDNAEGGFDAIMQAIVCKVRSAKILLVTIEDLRARCLEVYPLYLFDQPIRVRRSDILATPVQEADKLAPRIKQHQKRTIVVFVIFSVRVLVVGTLFVPGNIVGRVSLVIKTIITRHQCTWLLSFLVHKLLKLLRTLKALKNDLNGCGYGCGTTVGFGVVDSTEGGYFGCLVCVSCLVVWVELVPRLVVSCGVKKSLTRKSVLQCLFVCCFHFFLRRFCAVLVTLVMSNSSTELCSNRGECVCGECQCYNPQGGGRVFGQWCQCDSFSCERDAESRVCGGPERGQCCGGECQCNTGWGGSACDCSADTSTCVAPGDPAGRMCGGHGDCVCGACRCRADAGGRYSGPFCQDCAACVGRCSEFRSCVQCTMFGSGEQSEKCRSECSKLNIVPVDKAEEAGPEERKCIFKDVDDCFFSFVYYYDENNEPVIEAQKTKECGKEALTWYIVGGVVGGIVIFGLLAVCIGRFLLYLKDKLEYEKFVKERKNAAWRLEMNPIFKEPVSEYRNPMYETGQSSTAGLSSSRS
ncbi:unnamed protein product, partial [Ixodes persulcatus]